MEKVRVKKHNQILQTKLEEVLAQNTRLSGPASIILVLLILSVIWNFNALNFSILTLGGILISALVIRTWWGFKKSNNWHLFFTAINLVVSLSWFALLITAFQIETHSQTISNYIYLVVAGLIGASANSLALSRRDYYVFMTCALLPVLIKYSDPSLGAYYMFSGMSTIVIFSGFLIRQRSHQEKSWRILQTFNYDLENLIDSLPVGVAVIRNGSFKNYNNMFSRVLLNSTNKIQSQEAINKLLLFSEQNEINKTQWEIRLTDENGVESIYFFLAIKATNNLNSESIVSVMNINDVRSLELEVQKQKMQIENSSKMAALGVMSSGLAHEINNPLATITGRAQLMQMVLKNTSSQLDPNHLEKLNKSLEVIQKTIQRISKIIKGLRSFARETEGDPFEVVKLQDVIETTLSFCESRLVSRGVEVKTHIEGDIKFSGRSAEISQVLLNALNNSCDAVDSVHSKWIKLNAYQLNDRIVIKVQDSGEGINPSLRDKIMVPFFTTKDVGKGTGLGLSISKGIVESHGGQMYFNYSSPHTELVIELPLPIEKSSTQNKRVS